jgi:DHA2 family multidrug resistance protein
MRNIGSSIGISVVEAVLINNTQIIHSELGAHITPYDLHNPAFTSANININTDLGIAQLNHMITDQAQMIAYINDFKMMMVLTLVLMPLLLIIHVPKRAISAAVHATMD